jgi:hypothetical protein
MNLNVYLPDELGAWAKKADLPLSRMLRGAVERERERQHTVDETLGRADVYRADVEGEDGLGFTVKIHGTLLAASGTVRAFIGRDEQVFAHDSAYGGDHALPG